MTQEWKLVLGSVALSGLAVIARSVAGCDSAASRAATERAIVRNQAESDRAIENTLAALRGRLLTKVEVRGLREVTTSGYIGYAGGQKILISLSQEEPCHVTDPKDWQEGEEEMHKQGVTIPEEDASRLRQKASLPVFLLRYEKAGWEFVQGDESCSVQVKTMDR